MMRGTRIALLAVTALTVTSSFLFMKQGGFGGGHGRFDLVIAVLGLPWVWLISQVPLVYWPTWILQHDFVWLLGMPFILNVATVFVVTATVRRMRRRGSESVPQRAAGKV